MQLQIMEQAIRTFNFTNNMADANYNCTPSSASGYTQVSSNDLQLTEMLKLKVELLLRHQV